MDYTREDLAVISVEHPIGMEVVLADTQRKQRILAYRTEEQELVYYDYPGIPALMLNNTGIGFITTMISPLERFGKPIGYQSMRVGLFHQILDDYIRDNGRAYLPHENIFKSHTSTHIFHSDMKNPTVFEMVIQARHKDNEFHTMLMSANLPNGDPTYLEYVYTRSNRVQKVNTTMNGYEGNVIFELKDTELIVNKQIDEPNSHAQQFCDKISTWGSSGYRWSLYDYIMSFLAPVESFQTDTTLTWTFAQDDKRTLHRLFRDFIMRRNDSHLTDFSADEAEYVVVFNK